MIHQALSYPERIATLETQAENLAKKSEDVESRLRRLERAYYIGTGITVALQFLFKYIL